jgi:hypothetical protein
MNAVLEQIAPETINALVAQATANGLSVNDYLQRLLNLNDEENESEDLSLIELPKKAPSFQGGDEFSAARAERG